MTGETLPGIRGDWRGGSQALRVLRGPGTNWADMAGPGPGVARNEAGREPVSHGPVTHSVLLGLVPGHRTSFLCMSQSAYTISLWKVTFTSTPPHPHPSHRWGVTTVTGPCGIWRCRGAGSGPLDPPPRPTFFLLLGPGVGSFTGAEFGDCPGEGSGRKPPPKHHQALWGPEGDTLVARVLGEAGGPQSGRGLRRTSRGHWAEAGQGACRVKCQFGLPARSSHHVRNSAGGS